MLLHCTSTPPNSLLFSLFLLKVDAAAETQPRKEDALTDSILSPVPEVVSAVCCVSKATQTQAPPTSPPPSTREKVRSTWKDTVWWKKYTDTNLQRAACRHIFFSLFFSSYKQTAEQKGRFLFFFPDWSFLDGMPNSGFKTMSVSCLASISFTVGVIFVNLCRITSLTFIFRRNIESEYLRNAV